MNKEKCDHLFDIKIEEAGLKYFEKVAEAAEKEEMQEYKESSEELDKKIKASINKYKHSLRLKRTIRVVLLVFTALLLVVGISCVTIKSTEALRIKFNNLFLFETGETLELSAPNDLDKETLPEGSDFIKPGYMPKGCVLTEANITVVNITNTYLNKDNNIIRISRSQTVGSITIDKENSDNYETQINGNRSIVVKSNDKNSIYYFSNNYFYHIVGEGIGVEELIKIAENLPK